MTIYPVANIAAFLRSIKYSSPRIIGLMSMLLVLSGCGFFTPPHRLQVELRFDGRPLPCGTALSLQGSPWYLEHSKFYLSQWQDQEGNSLHLENNKWQTGETVLVSIEQRDCWQDGEMLGNHRVVFDADVDLADVQQLQFVLGIPFAQNHQNPLAQPSPLNLSSMFWTWQSGHKFARFELKSVADSWAFHLGSTGCAADSAMRAPAEACEQPNLLAFSLQRPKGKGETLVFHLDRLIEGIRVSQENSCTFHPNETASCEQLLSNLRQSVIEWI